MEVGQYSVIMGAVVAIGFVVISLWRQRKLALADLGSFGAVYFAGTNIPAGVFLALYAIYPDGTNILTKLHGYEKYVSYAGMALVFTACVGVAGVYANAFQKPNKPDGT